MKAYLHENLLLSDPESCHGSQSFAANFFTKTALVPLVISSSERLWCKKTKLMLLKQVRNIPLLPVGFICNNSATLAGLMWIFTISFHAVVISGSANQKKVASISLSLARALLILAIYQKQVLQTWHLVNPNNKQRGIGVEDRCYVTFRILSYKYHKEGLLNWRRATRTCNVPG